MLLLLLLQVSLVLNLLSFYLGLAPDLILFAGKLFLELLHFFLINLDHLFFLDDLVIDDAMFLHDLHGINS